MSKFPEGVFLKIRLLNATTRNHVPNSSPQSKASFAFSDNSLSINISFEKSEVIKCENGFEITDSTVPSLLSWNNKEWVFIETKNGNLENFDIGDDFPIRFIDKYLDPSNKDLGLKLSFILRNAGKINKSDGW